MLLTLEQNTKNLTLEDLDFDRVERAVSHFLCKRAVPGHLRKDCRQEAWIARLESRDIWTHLCDWLDKEYHWRQPQMYSFDELYRRAKKAGKENQSQQQREVIGTPQQKGERSQSDYLSGWAEKDKLRPYQGQRSAVWEQGLFGVWNTPTPLQILIAKIDRVCPWCNKREGKKQEGGFYLHRSNGECYAGDCVCGFWF